ncbi:MAG: TatD family hydrolase [Bacteroidales bacterium]|nr:TatD family hydrolase [Bacteroidales bacterium]
MRKFVVMYIDTHTHYTDEAFGDDAAEAVGRAVAAGVGKMIQADIDSAGREAMFSFTEKFPDVLYPMLGLYPGSVNKEWRSEIEAMLPYRDRGIVAIGEIGLDYHEGREFCEQQKQALREQFELAAAWDLPVNIHLRDATEDFIRILADCAHLHLRGDLHCFSLSHESYMQVLKYGDFYVGVGGVVTFKNASLAETIKKIPLDRILLETDCPYLAPTPHRGTRNESAYIPLIAEKIAQQKQIDVAEVEETTTDNARKLFGI